MIVHFILDCSPEFLLAHFKESRDVLGFSTTTTNLRSSIVSIPRLFIKRNKNRYFAKNSKSRKGGNRSAQFVFLKHSYLHGDHAIAVGGAKSNKIPIMTLKKPENTKSPSWPHQTKLSTFCNVEIRRVSDELNLCIWRLKNRRETKQCSWKDQVVNVNMLLCARGRVCLLNWPWPIPR